jgi:gas vesicle protein
MPDKRKDILEELRVFQKREKNTYFPHGFIAVGLDDKGFPTGTATMIEGSPAEMLGMIKLLMEKLKSYEKDLVKKIYHGEKVTKNSLEENSKRLSELLNRLPPEVKEKIQNLKERFDKAIEDGDIQGMEDLKKGLLENMIGKDNLSEEWFKKEEENDEDEDPDFNIDDFIA